MKDLLVPLLIITVGVAWLLATLGVLPEVIWVWTLGLGMAGVLTFALGGWNKFTVVTGPLLIVSSVFSVLRQTGRLDLNHEIPILVIALGVLLLVSRSKAIPIPDWVLENKE